MSFTPTAPIAPFFGWTQFTPALPEFYWDVYSAEERIKKICCELHKLCEYANMLGENINIDHQLIDELQDAFTKFMESGFDDYYKAQIEAWINDHFINVMKAILNHGVFFGLTQDGYFCANYVWQLMIVFDTIMDYQNDNYGKLVLSY